MTLQLDQSQVAAVEIEPETRQIVIAGPGSGKTEVVAALLQHLATAHGADLADELLVLSFSRAAVHAVTRRLRESESLTVAPAVRTLDSLAVEILADNDREHEHLSFDDRIAAAASVVRDQGWHALEVLLHVVVDEVQDVVGLRADFLLALLRALPREAGFTLLGDPAQAIYDFQLDGRSATTSTDLLREAAGLGEVRHQELTGQYRAGTRETAQLMGVRSTVLEGTHLSARKALTAIARVVPLGSVDDAVAYLPRWAGSTAFLTRTNGQALLVAEALWKRDVRTTVRRPAADRPTATWVAHVVRAIGRDTFDRSDFESAAAALLSPDEIASAWRAVRTTSRARGPRVEARSLAAGLTGGRAVPGDLLAEQESSVVVSTVHRAKGLEFDNVVLADFPDDARPPGDGDGPDEARRMYVAVTRARVRLGRATGPKTWNLRRDESTGRWYLRGREGWQTFGFGLRGSDMDRRRPPGSDPGLVQDHLAAVGVGDPLQLRLETKKSTLDVPAYAVIHEGTVIGTTSADFGKALASRIGPATRRKRGTLPWPILSGAHVEALETVAGRPAEGMEDVGRSGLWLGVRPAGMLRLSWKEEADA